MSSVSMRCLEAESDIELYPAIQAPHIEWGLFVSDIKVFFGLLFNRPSANNERYTGNNPVLEKQLTVREV